VARTTLLYVHFYQSLSSFFVLVPAGVSLLTTERQYLSQFTRPYHNVVEGDQSATLCMRLLGRGGVVNAYLSLLDGTAKGVCDIQVWWNIRMHFSGMGSGYSLDWTTAWTGLLD